MRPKVGLLALMFKLYDAIPELESEMAIFSNELVDIINEFADLEWKGICKTRDEVTESIELFEKKDVDIVIIILLTYTPSLISLRALKKTNLPILIFNTQKLYEVTENTEPNQFIRNHGMHGVQDLANVLIRAKRDFILITGYYKDQETLKEIREWCEAASVANLLDGVRVGMIGHTLIGMGDFEINKTSLLSQIGVDVLQISQANLAKMAKNAPFKKIEEQMNNDYIIFDISEDITKEEHEENSRLEWAIRETLKKEKMSAFTMNFMSISDESYLKSLPFLAASKMLAEDYGYSGEGDILTSVMVTIMKKLTKDCDFTEMFTIDFGGDSIIMRHMGEGNYKLSKEGLKVRMVRSDLNLVDIPIRPLLLLTSLKPGIVTLSNLTVNPEGKLKIICTEGEILDFPIIRGVKSPHFKFRPVKPINDFLTELSLAGSSHHFAIAYGRLTSKIKKIAYLIDTQFVKI
jgi:L-arabinose isomerase